MYYYCIVSALVSISVPPDAFILTFSLAFDLSFQSFKFVRIKPNSVLEKLYPPSQHVPDRCLVCGYSFDNHLKAWWFPHLYSPFDRHLDDIYEAYAVSTDADQNNINKKKARTHHPPKNNQQKYPQRNNSYESKPTYAAQAESMDSGMRPMYNDSKQPYRTREFHKRYVEDISNEPNVTKKKRRKTLHARNPSNKATKMKQRKSTNHGTRRELAKPQLKLETRKQKQAFLPKYETRRIFNVRYRVPSMNLSNERHSFGSAILLAITRTMTLERLDELIRLEDREKRWYEWKLLRNI